MGFWASLGRELFGDGGGTHTKSARHRVVRGPAPSPGPYFIGRVPRADVPGQKRPSTREQLATRPFRQGESYATRIKAVPPSLWWKRD